MTEWINIHRDDNTANKKILDKKTTKNYSVFISLLWFFTKYLRMVYK